MTSPSDANRLTHFITPLREAGCRVSMFIGHDPRQIEASARIGAAVVELHTGHYSDLHAEGRIAEAEAELAALRKGCRPSPTASGLRFTRATA